jgi:hypothetical protein
MISIGALQVPSTPAEANVPRKQAQTENGTVEGRCRGRHKNSNAAIVRSRLRSGFFAVTGLATVEIFSAKIHAARARFPPSAGRNGYAGVKPKLRSKRLA